MRPNLLVVIVAFLLGLAIVLAFILADRSGHTWKRVETTNQTTSTLPASFDQFLWGKAEAEHEARLEAARAEKAKRDATRRRLFRAAQAQTAPTGSVYPTDELLHALAMCETGGTMNQRATSPSGRYLSYFQWALSTWHAAGGSGDPRDVSYEVQRDIARSWVLRAGWAQWPVCSRRIGAR